MAAVTPFFTPRRGALSQNQAMRQTEVPPVSYAARYFMARLIERAAIIVIVRGGGGGRPRSEVLGVLLDSEQLCLQPPEKWYPQAGVVFADLQKTSKNELVTPQSIDCNTSEERTNSEMTLCVGVIAKIRRALTVLALIATVWCQAYYTFAGVREVSLVVLVFGSPTYVEPTKKKNVPGTAVSVPTRFG